MNSQLQLPILEDCIQLLEQLIRIPSFSRQENETADCLEMFFRERGLSPQRQGHNVWLRSRQWQDGQSVILLNSHHDTVKPAADWKRDPFSAVWEDDILYGLGSNDAGGPLVSLIAAFLHLENVAHLPFNLILAATAEEEISGAGGVVSILPALGTINGGMVGEPTSLDVAIAERGLVVIDGEAKGRAGHAAREEGLNALYIAVDDISRLRNYQFPKSSELLGPVKVSITQIEAGRQHNVVPDRCRFVLDVRVNEHYTNAEVVQQLQSVVQSELIPRSLRLQSSGIAPDHPLALAASALGLTPYGSPTLSDQALLPFPTIKLGPGDSARSHTADEYIKRSEIEAGVTTYLKLLSYLCR